MKKLNKIKEFLIKNNSEILVILGLFFIVLATFLLSYIAGIYVLGGILATLGIFVAIKPKK